MKKNSLGIYIIASALIWGFVIIGCSLKLRDTVCYDKISLVLVGGFLAHLIIIWAPLTLIFIRKNKDQETTEKSQNP